MSRTDTDTHHRCVRVCPVVLVARVCPVTRLARGGLGEAEFR